MSGNAALVSETRVFSYVRAALNFGAQGWDRVDQPLQTRSRLAVAPRRRCVVVVPNLPVMLYPFARIAGHNDVARQETNDRLVLPVKQDGRIAL
jgi:hypothetical protein